MTDAILLLNFGEPEDATLDDVVEFLNRIFVANGGLENGADADSIRARSRQLATARAPSLLEDYRRIGGSPMNAQAREQAELLGEALRRRGRSVPVFVGMQYTEPTIAAAVAAARQTGARRVVSVPVYPMCGPSTTLAALDDVRAELARQGWKVDARELAGWHSSGAYVAMRAAAIGDVARQNGLRLSDERVRLVFSAHGTPLKYVDAGSPYVRFVEEHCRAVAAAVGAARYRIGYQNHGHRASVPWTQPEVADVICEIDADSVIVDPISFVHEQSETLVELDVELRAVAEARGLHFHRVPIRHAAPELITLLADLVEPLLTARAS
jgi:protoporphyrin/coproporphyrin ferrochelatase